MWTWTSLFLRQNNQITSCDAFPLSTLCLQSGQSPAAKSDSYLPGNRPKGTSVPVPEDCSLFLLQKNSFFDATVWLNDRWVLDTRLLVPATIHLIRISFLGETRMLTANFRPGQAYRLQLEGQEDSMQCRLERVPSRPVPRQIQPAADSSDWYGPERRQTQRASQV